MMTEFGGSLGLMSKMFLGWEGMGCWVGAERTSVIVTQAHKAVQKAVFLQ